MIQAIDIYYRLRDEVDQKAAALEKQHAEWMACRKGCCSCCLNLTVWPVEFYAILEAMKAAKWPKPQLNADKECSLLDEEGGCQIYPFRPIICRTHGLPLVYWHEETDPPGWGVMFCEQNFTAAYEIDFGPGATPIKHEAGWLNIYHGVYPNMDGSVYVHSVVFTCAAVPENDGTLKLYWGAAGTANIDELVDLCLTDSRPPM